MTYSFQCAECGKTFDKQMSIKFYKYATDKEFTFGCPNCYSKKLKRIYSVPIIIYKDKDFTLHKEKE